MVTARLKTPWQLIRLATKAAPNKSAAAVATTPYAIAVSMVLDRIEDKRSILRVALKNERILVAKELLTEIYDTEYALRVRIDLPDGFEFRIAEIGGGTTRSTAAVALDGLENSYGQFAHIHLSNHGVVD